ncbi:MAG: transposase [Proteobacteria bacterium]|nr:transposase [Pseudomonadota bacterium]MBU1709786.1 transposase [Pseudomonadota bacterium]
MARPLRIQYPGAVYHVTHRGNERKPIFKDDADRNKFLSIISLSAETYTIIIHSYVLMSNHFHLLVETPQGNLAEFMRHFNISYTSYFNRRYKRSGNLYQGRYKSFLIEKEVYLARVSRYIHLNPVRIQEMARKQITEQLEYLFTYPWSSLPGFAALGKRLKCVEYGYVLEEFGGDTKSGRNRFKKQIESDLQKGLRIREDVVGQSILGSAQFIEEMREKLPEKKDRERPSVSKVHKHKARGELLEIISEITGTPQKNIISQKGILRHLAMDILYRFGGFTNPEIGKIMGVDYSTVSQGRKRLRAKAGKDKSIKALVQRIEAKCQG